MKLTTPLTALLVSAVLLSVPAAAGCGGAAMMSSDCPMVGMAGTVEMEGSMAGSPCHESAQMPDDCCDIEPTPEPIQAPSFETVKLFIALEALELPVTEIIAPPARPASTPVAAGLPEHDVGRYRLFSSLLL